jgi:DTW domain-containing protein YfiP
MHPKEFRKSKNGTGHFTNLSLENCEIFVGVDFSKNKKIAEIIYNNSCYILYPSDKSIDLNKHNIAKGSKKLVLFIIDSTWPCSRAILRASPNIDALQKVSFDHNKSSNFIFKKQPQSYCLSTIESTHCVLEIFNRQQIENIDRQSLKNFLRPFHKMVEYQLNYNL